MQMQNEAQAKERKRKQSEFFHPCSNKWIVDLKLNYIRTSYKRFKVAYFVHKYISQQSTASKQDFI